jgi:hypothetical protein
MNKLIIYLIFINIFTVSKLIAQDSLSNCDKLYDIDIRNMHSDKILIYSDKKDIENTLGSPDIITHICNRYIVSKGKNIDSNLSWRDTLVCYDVLAYYKTYGLSYYLNADSVFLNDINFKICKGVQLKNNSIILDENTTLSEFKLLLNSETLEDIVIYNSYFIPYKTKHKDRASVVTLFSKGKYSNSHTQFYFDKKNKLRFISFGYNE